MNEKQFIIITTIFDPSEAVKKFSRFKGWTMIVVGDRKTPVTWSCKNVIYLSPKTQQKESFRILKHLPWNHYCRKMVGYLYAMRLGAEVIYDTDDDNIPLSCWAHLPDEGKYQTLTNPGFFNIYSSFSNKKVWPRGLPLDEILLKKAPRKTLRFSRIGIWQHLANGDPDVDAIYRLTNNTPVFFNPARPLVLEAGAVCPINSQNTFFHKAAFPLLFLPAFVTFRFTDILRGLVAQPILWNSGLRVGFGKATVVQKRNPHDYIKDFASEIPVFLHSRSVIERSIAAVKVGASIPENLINVYSELLRASIVTKKETQLLYDWCEDISSIARIGARSPKI